MRRADVLVLALAILAVPAAAQVYQWRDADGRVHFSDVPPPSEDARMLRDKAAPGADEAPGSSQAPQTKTLAEKELEFRQRRADAAEAAAKARDEKARAAEREHDCERARNQLAALNSGMRVVRYNAQGERESLNDSERTAEIQRTQQYVDAACK